MNPLAPLSPPRATSLDDLIQSGLIPQVTVSGVLLQDNELRTGESRWRLGFVRPLLMRLKSGPASVTGYPGIDPMPELSPRFNMSVTMMGPPGDGPAPVPGPGWLFDDLVAQGYVQSLTLVGIVRRAGTDGPVSLDVQGLQIRLQLGPDLMGLQEGLRVQVQGRPDVVLDSGGPTSLRLVVQTVQPMIPVLRSPAPPSPPPASPPPSPAGLPAAPGRPAPPTKRRARTVVLCAVGLAGVLGLGLGLWWRAGR